MKRFALVVGIAAFYFLAARIGLSLAIVHPNISPVWPPSGIAVAAILLFGYEIWPGVLAGAFLANAFTSISLAAAAGIAIGNTLEALAVRFLLLLLLQSANPLDRAKDVFGFVLIAATSCAIAAVIGVTSLSLGGYAQWDGYASALLTWWLGDTIGVLLLTPVFLAWSKRPRMPWNSWRLAEIVAFGVLIYSVMRIAYGYAPSMVSQYPMTVVLLPFLVWAVFRFGQRGVSLTILGISGLAIWNTMHGVGPFSRGSPNESLLLLQSYMCVLSVTILTMAAVVTERTDAEAALRVNVSDLDRRVRERTQILEKMNKTLTTEIMERKQIEASLLKERDFVQTLVHAAPTFFVAIDAQGKTLMMNRAMLETLGYQANEVVGTDYLSNFVPEADRAALSKIFTDLVQQNQPTLSQNRVLTKDRRELLVEWHGRPVFKANRSVDFFFGVGIDITERKRVEEALQRQAHELARSNEDLERFAYSASHDLREPLRMVTSYSDLLAKRYKDRLDHDGVEFLGYISDAAERMEQLITGILGYSRVGTGREKYTRTDLNALLMKSMENLKSTIQENQATVTQDVLPVLLVNPTEITQLFQNLIGNAIKFHGKESPRVHVSTMQQNNEWLFLVRDNGIGIEPQYTERIFKMFERLHTRSEYSGTGLGLALCKKVVQGHLGRIWVESQPGKGSVFYFTLPT